MDPALSMIMANMGSVRESDFVFDPFVGTGMYEYEEIRTYDDFFGQNYKVC